MRIGVLLKTAIDLAKEKRYMLAAFVPASLILSAISTIFVVPPAAGTGTATFMGGIVFSYLIPLIVIGVVGMLLYIYTVLYVVADSSAVLLSRERAIRALSELPNYIVTNLFVAVRLLPFVLISLVVVGVVTYTATGIMIQSRFLFALLVVVAFLPVAWGIARMTSAFFLTVTTSYRYWSATARSVALYKSNRGTLLWLVVPVYAIFAAATFVAILQAPAAMSTSAPSAMQSFGYSAVSVFVGTCYLTLFSVLVRNCVDRAEITAT